MDELLFEADDHIWEAGFEGGRSVVVTRLGPVVRVAPRPARFVKRFYHEVFELPIEDWEIPVEPLVLGSFCTVSASVTVRFQPTLRYARDHLEALPELGRHIRRSHQALLRDQVEEHLRRLEADPAWLEQGCATHEKAIEREINEQLAIRYIQCRARCSIAPVFGSLEENEAAAPWSRHRALYLEILRRQRMAEEQAQQEAHAQALLEQQRRLEQEEQLLAVKQREEALRKARLEQELESLRAELRVEEAMQDEQRDSEARQRQEQIRHTVHLRELELDADINEKTRRAQTMDDMEEHIKREIELLAMERQRLLLEEEVRDVKVAKAKGWVINAKKRFPLGEGRHVLQGRDKDAAEEGESG